MADEIRTEAESSEKKPAAKKPGLKIELYRNKTVQELSESLSDPQNKAGTGSATAAVGALAAGLLCRATALIALAAGKKLPREQETPSSEAAAVDGMIEAAGKQNAGQESEDRLDWLLRNTALLRRYFSNLIDEDVRCRGPLRKALQEGDARKIEAARQVAGSICAEVIHMSGTALELIEELAPMAEPESRALLLESAELFMAAAESSVPCILYMGSFSSDETYRYVLKRENELNLAGMRERLDSVRGTLAEG